MTAAPDRPTPSLRLATEADGPTIDALMKASTAAIFPAFYPPDVVASSLVHIAHLDPLLVEDGTYFVLEADGEVVACGGWSKHDKLFSGAADQEGKARLLDPATEPARVRAMFVRGDWTRRGLGTRILDACEDAAKAAGFTDLSLMATLPGYELYGRYGYREVERVMNVMPDGVTLELVRMEKPITRQGRPARGDPPRRAHRPARA